MPTETHDRTTHRDEILNAILAGDRTEQQIADRLSIDLAPIRDYRDSSEIDRAAPARTLRTSLNSLVCADLIFMKVVDAQWHYLPTKKARGLAKAHSVRTELGFDPDHWTATDGHRHVSVATQVPIKWRAERRPGNPPVLQYISGEYRIVREAYGSSAWSFRLYRGAESRGMWFYSRLADAKRHAAKNAAGHEVVNVA